MGFFDKMKGAVQAMTGGAAKVTLEYQPAVACPGETVTVRITATSTGGEVTSKGVFVDLEATEEVRIRANTAPDIPENIHVQKDTASQAFQVAPAFTLAPNETKQFDGSFQLPLNFQPSYAGHFTSHHWKIRGRVEAFGNDPDSGYVPFRVGLRA